MRIASLICLCLCLLSNLAFAQMYDQHYTGPVNEYGQPAYSVVPKNPNAPQQPQWNGVFPTAGQALYGVGSYFWNYMPAPMTGAQSPYTVQPGQGEVQTQFVPGTR
jgi:hypothetical protein